MHLDVQDLRNFYYREPLGRAAQRALRNKVLQFWPDLSGQTIAGFGFATPLLRPFLPQARRVIALMPGPQGVLAWPNPSQNVSVLTDERFWPLETGHVDRLIVLHGLETSEDANTVLQEAYRVLGPGGGRFLSCPIGLDCGRVAIKRRWGLAGLTAPASWKHSCDFTAFCRKKLRLPCFRSPPIGAVGKKWDRFLSVLAIGCRGLPAAY